MSKTIVFYTDGSAPLGWLAENDCVVESLQVHGGVATDLVVSTDPNVDINAIINPLQVVFTEYIAFFSTGPAAFQLTMPTGYPVLAGQSVFISADAPCVVQLTISPSIIL